MHGEIDFYKYAQKCGIVPKSILLAFYRPTTLNLETAKRFEGNLFPVLRPFHFNSKTRDSIDLGIFLNGLLIFTVELKNDFKWFETRGLERVQNISSLIPLGRHELFEKACKEKGMWTGLSNSLI
ncbi:type I restriction endonuclease [Reticulibacter mediterranei]|uniref:type I restriction endonuclease n=1 Tax=Reticulibacter mediterranei TaxID=2778369 RepID=UPI003570BB7A